MISKCFIYKQEQSYFRDMMWVVGVQGSNFGSKKKHCQNTNIINLFPYHQCLSYSPNLDAIFLHVCLLECQPRISRFCWLLGLLPPDNHKMVQNGTLPITYPGYVCKCIYIYIHNICILDNIIWQYVVYIYIYTHLLKIGQEGF